MQSRLIKAVLLFSAAGASTCALAHTGADAHTHTGFIAGFMHPLTGLDHMAVMVCVGIWSALAARRFGPELLWGPLAFANMLLVGAAFGLQGVHMAVIEPMIAASVFIMGLLLATRLPVPAVAATLLTSVFAVFHGLSHGLELSHNASAFQTLAGMLCATAALHCTGLAMGWTMRKRSAWVPRTLGAGVAAMGGALLIQLG
jgi:urease accessory protein